MLRLTRIEEGACYVTDTTKLYVAWSMLCSSSTLFWGCGIIKELDRALSLFSQAFGEKPEALSELFTLLQSNESPVLDAVRIAICFDNYFKAQLLLKNYLVHEMNLDVCRKNYPQFITGNAKKELLLQKTTPILIADVKQAEKQDDWSAEPLQTLTKYTIAMNTLIEEPKYREVYSTKASDDQQLFSILRRLHKTRNTLHFLSIEYAPGEIGDFAFLRDYVSNHIDALANKILDENKPELDVGKAEIRHLEDIEFD